MNMIPFIVTLLVFSTINVDAQKAYSIFTADDGFEISRFVFNVAKEEDSVEVSWQWNTENILGIDLTGLQVFLHESPVSTGCTGDLYQSESYNDASHVNCTTNELGCIATNQGLNFWEGDLENEPFVLNGVTVEELVGLSVAIYNDSKPVLCANIYNSIMAIVRSGGLTIAGSRLNLFVELDGTVDSFTTSVEWNPAFTIDQIQIRENPAIDGNCSTTGDIFNPVGHNRTCAYGNLTCEAEQPDNDIPYNDNGRRLYGIFSYMNAQTLFCGGNRSLVVIFQNETEPSFCGTFSFTNGPIPVSCPTKEDENPTDGNSTLPEDENPTGGNSTGGNSTEIEVEVSSAIAGCPGQGYLFLVFFCMCAFYFQ